MRFLSSVLFLALLAVPAAAQPWYARGDFFSWDLTNEVNQMVVDPGDATHYTANFSGLFDNAPYNWKIAEADWSPEMPGIGPGNDGRVYTDAAGEIHLHMYDQTTWNDGWYPNDVRRVGYNDHQQFDWEIVGTFNGWSGAADPAFALTDMGNGLHTGTFPMTAGGHEFKFRGLTATAWDTTIGQYFRNSANNNTFFVGANGDPWTFELDLPHGKFRYFTTAEPPGQTGDYNEDGIVDAADYTVWRDNLGSTTALPHDPNGAPVGPASYDTWKAHFGEGTLLTWFARNTPIGGQTQIPDQNLVSLGGGQYELNLTGLTAGTDYDFRILKTDLSAAAPSNNMHVRANANGEIGLNFYELQSASWGDGWSPSSSNRIGYDDHDQFDWQLTGSFVGWGGDPAYNLTDQGNGLHTGVFTFATPGNYEFKFRQVDDWNTSIGADFGNNASNGQFSVTNPGEMWHFELDLPNGRWRAYLDGSGAAAGAVPEPGSLALALAGLLVGAAVRRRR